MKRKKKVTVRIGGSFRSLLRRLHAPEEILDWVGHRSLRCVYRICDRGDRLIWFATHMEINRGAITLAVCECVRPTLSLVSPHARDQLRSAIEASEKWARGEAELDVVREAGGRAFQAVFMANQSIALDKSNPLLAAANAADSACAYASRIPYVSSFDSFASAALVAAASVSAYIAYAQDRDLGKANAASKLVMNQYSNTIRRYISLKMFERAKRRMEK